MRSAHSQFPLKKGSLSFIAQSTHKIVILGSVVQVRISVGYDCLQCK